MPCPQGRRGGSDKLHQNPGYVQDQGGTVDVELDGRARQQARQVHAPLQDKRHRCVQGSARQLQVHPDDCVACHVNFSILLLSSDVDENPQRAGVLKSAYRSANRDSSSKSNVELASKIDTVASLLTGQMEGLKLAAQAVEDAGTSSPSLAAGMAQAVQTISQCGDVCTAAAELVPVQGGATFRSVQAFKEARFMMGSTNKEVIAGGSTRVFGEVVGRDKSRVWIGDADAKTALEFMNG